MPNKVVPMLHVPDVRRTVDWYREIGFDVTETHGDGRDFLQAGCDAIDAVQLGFALNVEGVNAFAQGELDFAFGFTNACKHAFPWITPGGDDATQLTLAHDVEAAPQPLERAQHGDVRVRLIE